MNWDAIGTIAEIVGAAAVVVSLIYLSFQVKQNTKVSRASTRQALADGAQRNAADLIENDDLARLFVDALDGKAVKPHETLRLEARCFRDLRFWDNAYYQYTEGLLSEKEWQAFRENLKLLLQFPYFHQFWQSYQMIFSEPFREELNSLTDQTTSIDLRSNLAQGGSPTDEG
jgi:hypothetical protein